MPILTVLPGPSSRSKNSRWANLTSIFLVITIVLEWQAWFQVCVVPMVSITSRVIIPLAWCHRRSVTSSWNLSTNVSWSSSTFDPFQDINWIHDEKYPPCPRWFVLSSTTLLPSVQHKLVRVSSNPIAFKLMVDISFLDYCLLNHLSNIDHAT